MKTPLSPLPRSGFSLVELLVVVAIIALLAAMLFPAFSRARDNARRASCQSNLKQIGLSLQQYVQDYSSQYPPDNAISLGASPNGWAFLIQPYAKSIQILQCPSEETAPSPLPSGLGYTDYGANKYILGLHEASLTSPANTIQVLDLIRSDSASWDNGTDSGMYFDCRGDSTAPRATPGAATWLYRPNEKSLFRYAERHLEGGNYLLADNHVKYFKPLSISNNCTAPGSNTTFAYK
jgi:prepilin-type N-terminal cleavage/methylation domain-containing protein/prepilin-type processing-associated H-X9-DG protein